MEKPYFKTILLSEEIARSLREIDCFLNRTEFRVRVAGSPDEIEEAIRREPPDALMVDAGLTGGDVERFCRRLRDVPGASPAMPLVLVGPPDQDERSRRAGCNEYVASPATPNTLLHRLAGSLRIQFRLHTRVPAVISVSFGRIVSEFLGYSKDISVGGVLVESSLELPLDRRLHLRLFLEERERPIVARASVLRVERITEEDQYLLGLKFQDLDARASSRIESFIRSRTDS